VSEEKKGIEKGRKKKKGGGKAEADKFPYF